MKRMVSFVLEITLTLLPYILLLMVLLTTTSIVFHNRLGIIFALLSLVLAFKLIPFAFIGSAQANNSNGDELKIAVFNKLYSNKEYGSMDEIIREVDADILGITEIKEEDKKHIPFLKDYQYKASLPSRDSATLSLYSKYPITVIDNHNLPHTLVAKTIIHNSLFIILLTHPKPMLNPDWLAMRNAELKSLSEYIKSSDFPVIVLGDFNITPWSNSYQLLDIPTIKNVSKGTGIHFTTRGIFNAQVDHIFVPTSTNVNSFNLKEVSGSDHKLIWASVSL